LDTEEEMAFYHAAAEGQIKEIIIIIIKRRYKISFSDQNFTANFTVNTETN